MAETARPAMSRGRAPNRIGAAKNEKKTTLPTHRPSASRWTNLRSAATWPRRAARSAAAPSLAEDELVGRPFHHRALGRAPEHVPLDLPGEREVPLGDAARGVRLQDRKSTRL